MEWLARKTVGYYFSKGMIDSDDLEVYQYYFEVLFIKLLNYSCFIVIGALMGELLKGMVFSAIFILLRSNAGGWHANTVGKCFALTQITYGAALMIMRTVTEKAFILSLLGASTVGWIIIFLKYLPAIDERVPLDEQDKKLCKIRMEIFFTGSLFLGGLFFLNGATWYWLAHSLAVIAVSMSALPAMKGGVNNEK